MTDAAEALVGPTMERLRHARHLDIDVPVVDQTRKRLAWRIKSVVETMRNERKIDEESYASFVRFSRAWDRAMIPPRTIARYGKEAMSGGTPLLQLTGEAFDGAERAELNQQEAVDEVHDALLSINWQRAQYAIVIAASEQCNLDMIGQRIAPEYGDRGKRISIAMVALKDGLQLLHGHYVRQDDMRRNRRRPHNPP